jgi:transposase
VQAWVDKVYPGLRRRARKNGASIFFLDEAGFDSEPRLGRTYGLKGQTPVVSTTGQRQKVNVISAVNASGAFWCQIYTERLNAQLFLQFLREFLRGRSGKVYLVVDGHPAHKANAVKSLIKELEGKLELHFLPPYAPDLNPDEFVWAYMKTNGVSKKPLRKNESLKERVASDLATIKGNRTLVPESGVKTGFESYLASMFAGFVVTFESLTSTSLSVRLKSGCDVRLQALESPLMTRV